ncbi:MULTISPECIES: cell wall metabolism sensor histidine kinase WalK [unclassified Gemella]|uniref:sensor histidine kinase n=1 Tax=unclassified Gemella TaxID=2624949 RepID=UPI001C0590CA|nr:MULTISPECIES: HAMP domain-containing sensor histidine kinase [unclassified Gemella]MBU0278669.1 HAMP domain-containing histidine kinase [Gemella sp. zg-1178]QWQ39224.1 HAMP domain-containing histidine kinase [Gemella sp. zg-570]
MINTLRRKFILVSVSTVTFVISAVFIIINFLNYNNISSRSDEVINKFKNEPILLREIIENGTENGSRGIVSSDKNFYNGFFIAQITDYNQIINIYNRDNSVGIVKAKEIIQEALDENNDGGYIDYYKYGYVDYGIEKYIVCANVERELGIFYQFLTNSIIVALVIIIVISIILVISSKKIVEPIEINYEKQKQFVTDASHELKTPLTIIISNADVLEMEVGKSKWLDNIHNQIERLTHLINSLVAFSRAEERENLIKNNFSMTNLVKSRLEDFQELANFKDKEIVADIAENIFYSGDKQTIMQVIDILLDNAIKYADDNSIINVNLTSNKKSINLVVRNKTEGIKEGDLSKVFDRFYRLDESRNSKTKGYGIGLSLAKLIIDRHKSQIKAYAPKDDEFIIDIKFLL